MSSISPLSTTQSDTCVLTTLRPVSGGQQFAGAVPLSFGVDLPRGAVHDDTRIELCALHDEPLVIQTTPLARWSDNSVKWMLIDVTATCTELASTEWTLRRRDAACTNLSACDVPDRTHFALEGNLLHLTRGTTAASVTFELHDGRVIEPRVRSTHTEANGPVRYTERLEGVFPKQRGLRFTCRVHTYSNSRLVRLDVRLHNPNRAKHPGGLWDLGDRGSITFDAFHVAIRSRDSIREIRWQSEPNSAEQAIDTGSLLIYQDSSGEANWQSPVHTNAQGRIPCRFRGYQVHAPGRTESGLRARPVVALDGHRSSIAVTVPEFREQFPSSISAEDDSVRVGLFPLEWDDRFELQGGEQKTHTIWIALSDTDSTIAQLASCHNPVRVSLPPAWHRATGAIPYFSEAVDDSHAQLNELLEAAIFGEDSLLERRKTIDEFGWRHFGEIHADHEQKHYDGEAPVVSHYNNQFDSIYGAILQYARTGDPNWYRLFDPLARHVVDIDIYHTQQDRAAYSGGMFWHTDHYVDAGTCTHRTYTAANAKPGQSYGGGPSDEHTYTTGLLYYYWLTGNPDARDTVLSLADWVINVDDGSQTVLGLVSGHATGGASATGSSDYHGPGRGAGNSLNAVLDAWQLTGDTHYLDFAETLIRRVIHPEHDVAALDLLNAELRWSYTVFLSALAKYLDLKHEAGQLDRSYEYAAASFAHFGRWMAEFERPYLDHPEELEFPTETWAAQEMRKANVLRLAAKYCDKDDQRRMLTRGDELAARAWEQLAAFGTRTVARSLAIMMSEGPRDEWLCQATFSPFERNSTVSFEPQTDFVPQKEQVKRQLRSPRGVTSMLTHAAVATRWIPFVRDLLRHF